MKVNQILTGNNLDVLHGFPNNSIDLIVTSPPYDKLREYQGFNMNIEQLTKILFSKMKEGAIVVWIINDQTKKGCESGTSFKHTLEFMKAGFNLHDTMIYVRMPRFPEQTRYFQAFEFMFVFSKGKIKTFNPIADRKNKYAGQKCHRGKHTVRKSDGTMKLMQKRNADDFIKENGNRLNLWYYSAGGSNSTQDKIAFKHPAIFPEKLAEDHIISWSNEGDLVVDIFNGSGTTTKMAYINGRNYIGIDISEKYNKIAEQRIKDAKKKKKDVDFQKKVNKNTQKLMDC